MLFLAQPASPRGSKVGAIERWGRIGALQELGNTLIQLS
jgi:hypothetical protein